MAYTVRIDEAIELDVNGDSVFIQLTFDMECTFGGSPATPPSFSSGGEPAESAEFEVEALYGYLDLDNTIYEQEIPLQLVDWLIGKEKYEELEEKAMEEAAQNYDPGDDWMDYYYEDDPRG